MIDLPTSLSAAAMYAASIIGDMQISSQDARRA
jgi:hypothetical protein